MGKKGKRTRKCKVGNKRTDTNSDNKRNFTITEKLMKETVNNSGGILTENDIKGIFNVK